jgi:hypothetical protein
MRSHRELYWAISSIRYSRGQSAACLRTAYVRAKVKSAPGALAAVGCHAAMNMHDLRVCGRGEVCERILAVSGPAKEPCRLAPCQNVICCLDYSFTHQSHFCSVQANTAAPSEPQVLDEAV